jgi:hypothetical protein
MYHPDGSFAGWKTHLVQDLLYYHELEPFDKVILCPTEDSEEEGFDDMEPETREFLKKPF